MKQRLTYLCILFAATMVLNGNVAAQAQKTSNCQEKLKIVLKEYGRLAESDALFIHYKHWEEIAGQVIQKETHKLWIKGDRLRYENYFFRFIQDSKVQVIIDKSSQTIVLQEISPEEGNQEGDMKSFLKLPISNQADSILSLAVKVNCGNEGRIEMSFPPSVNGKIQNLKSITWDYDSLSKRMIRQKYTWYSPVGVREERTEVYLYEALTDKILVGDLPENGLTLVYSGKELLPEYKDYKVMDLRMKK